MQNRKRVFPTKKTATRRQKQYRHESSAMAHKVSPLPEKYPYDNLDFIIFCGKHYILQRVEAQNQLYFSGKSLQLLYSFNHCADCQYLIFFKDIPRFPKVAVFH